MDWQPIESAPKDGTRVLVTDGVLFSTGQYGKLLSFGPQWWSDHPLAFLEADEQSVNYDFTFDKHVSEPTHWMPLPSPPTTNQGDEP